MNEIETKEQMTEKELTPKEKRLEKKKQKALAKQKKKEIKLREKDKFRRVRGVAPMTRLVPYIMETRNTSQNFIFDKINMDKIDDYIKEKQKNGLASFNLMHVILAAYVRACSQRPAINRFIRGQKIYTRKKVEISLVVKKEMLLESPDTVIKITVPTSATAEDIYHILNEKIESYRSHPNSGFDKLAKVLNFIPGIFLRWTIRLLRLLDYFGLLPRALTRLSPFHGSVFITSMGSLGIPPIVHHLYDFGTVPVFIAFGTKQREYKVDADGNVYKNSYVDVTYNLDERICDGFYYASAMKIIRGCYKNPRSLDTPPEKIVEDIR